MSGIMKNIFALGISIGLADREAFVKKASEYIQSYQDDPEKAEKWAEALVNYLEELKDNIRLQNTLESTVRGANVPDKDSIEELTKAVKQLTDELQKNKNQK